MTVYAILTDLQKTINADELLQLANDGVDGLDMVTINEALERSSREIDGYINKRYSVPVQTVTAELKNYCTRLARYWLRHNISPPEEKSPYLLDYTRALAELREIRDGDRELTGMVLKTEKLTDGIVLVESSPRLFGRKRR